MSAAIRRTIHVCQSISGALRNWSKQDWERLAWDNNCSASQAKEKFRIWELEGKKVVPIGEPCEGFSHETGCPGHETEEIAP